MDHQVGAPPDEPEAALPPDLRAVARRYARQLAPRPTASDTARLVARLLAEESTTGVARDAATAEGARRRWARALRVAGWRVRLLGPAFWVASVLLIAGAVLGVDRLAAHAPAWSALVLLAPLTAALGICHALRTPHRGLREVEASTAVGTPEALAGLVLAIVGCDCALGGLATLALALASVAPFVALLATWLGPLLLLSGVSLAVALRWGAGPAALVGGGPWVLLAAASRLEPVGIFAPPGDALAFALRLVAAALGGALVFLALLRGPAWPPPVPGRGQL